MLDLFCCAGGAGVGYSRAGFEVIGVDIKPQPHYPFEFIQMDAMEMLANPYGLFNYAEAVHASPPCQSYSATKALHDNEYPELIGEVREALRLSQLPYVIENVVGAPIEIGPPDLFGNAGGVVLCGSMFELGVRRHRLFESNVIFPQPRCRHDLVPEPIDVTGTGGPGGRHRKPSSMAQACEVMGIDWPITRREISEAVPPAYTEYLGQYVLESLAVAA